LKVLTLSMAQRIRKREASATDKGAL